MRKKPAKARKLTIRTNPHAAVTINRTAIRSEKLVYIAVATKQIKYDWGNSAVVYIGTTKAGENRIAASAAVKARELLDGHGMTSLRFYVVTCASRQKLRSWRKLEAALINTFRGMFGAVPIGNIQGKGKVSEKAVEYFTEDRLRAIIKKYSYPETR